MMSAFVRRAQVTIQANLPAGVAIAGAAALLGYSERWYPISQWLLWHYLGIILLTLFVGVAALSLGDFILRNGFRLTLPTHERVALGFVVGLTGFEIGMFLLGTVQAYHRTTFVLFPLFLSLLGLSQWRTGIRRFARLARVGPRLRPNQMLFLLFGAGSLALIYFSILTPYNVQFDARWKHMALAEDYVAHGGLRRMPEGWVFSARPHLTSYLYVWAFLLPKGSLFHRMELAAHLEFLAFSVTTLCAIPALVRRLIPRADARVVWVARFLFPGVFLYDSSLSAGADHFGALIAPALAIALIRAYREFDRRWVLLSVVCMSAAAMVKETVAIMLVPIPAAVLGVRAIGVLSHGSPERRRASFCTLATALGLGAILTAPFWLKNWIWYGNPVYPNLGSMFPSRPWSPAATYRFSNEYSGVQMWSPPRDLAGLATSLRTLFSFSFLPNDWSKYHGDRPVFGSLFTILVPILLWLRNVRRIWWCVGWIHGAIFTWYWVHHQDRYLQAILPLMAAVTASTLVLIHRQLRTVVRRAVGALVIVQLASTADVYFLATHAMAGSAIRRVVENLGFGHAGKFEQRFMIEPRYTAISKVLPSDARVLFHDLQSHLGTEREGVRDAALWQFGLNYSQARHPSEIHRSLTQIGVTHIVMSASKCTGNDRLAGDLLFYDFVYRRARLIKEIDGLLLFENPPKISEPPFRDRVVVVSCDTIPELALYPLASLAQPAVGPLSLPRPKPIRVTTDETEVQRWLSNEADFAVVHLGCEVPASVSLALRKVADRHKRGVHPAASLFVRRDG